MITLILLMAIGAGADRAARRAKVRILKAARLLKEKIWNRVIAELETRLAEKRGE